MNIVTSGESHGKGLFAIIEGLPAHLKIDVSEIDAQLALRQGGFGRGNRQKIECDRVEILSGARNGETLGSPLTLAVLNADYENWKDVMAFECADTSRRTLTKVRPGHADLAGALKFAQTDARNVLERASARETAIRVAVGAVCRRLLKELGVEICGYVRSVYDIEDRKEYTFDEILQSKSSVFGMLDRRAEAHAVERIRELGASGDTCGGVLEVRIRGLKSGFGSCMTYSEKLDARLVSAMMSVQAIKGAEVGDGFACALRKGSEVHDEIGYSKERGYFRPTNRAGGIEGGMSNGEEIVLRAAMKPIPTLGRGLRTVDIATKQPATAASERSDVCAVTACEVVLEAAIAAELAKVVCERLGGDTMDEMTERYARLPL